MEEWYNLLSLQIEVWRECQGCDLYNKTSDEYFTELYFEPGQGQLLFLAIPHYVHFRKSQPTL